MELWIYDRIEVQVGGIDRESISQMIQRTDSQRWHRGDQQNNWVWIKEHPGRWYCALNVFLLWQQHQLIKITL